MPSGVKARSIGDFPSEKALGIRTLLVDNDLLATIIHTEGPAGNPTVDQLQPQLAHSEVGPLIDVLCTDTEIAECLPPLHRKPLKLVLISSSDVSSQGQIGRHLLELISSDFDPGCVKTCAHEKRAELFSLLSCPVNRRQRFCFKLIEVETKLLFVKSIFWRLYAVKTQRRHPFIGPRKVER